MSGTAGSIRVLHVEDERSLAEMVATFLEREDERIEVLTAGDPEEGLAMLEAHDVDCVVSDYDMPGRNGIEFLEAVRGAHPDLPFILYTGKGSEEVAAEAISAGVTDYLQKEAGTDQYAILANRITNAVAQTRARREVEHTREYFGTILEHASDYVMIVDSDPRIDYVSPAVERVMGYDPDDLDGTDPFEFIHPEDRSLALEAFSDVLGQPGEERTVEYRVRHADGSWRWVEVRGRNLLDDPVIEGILVNVRDITADRRRRERRERQRETLVELVRDDAVASGDFEAAARRITETAAEVLDVPRVNIWLVEDGGGRLACVDHYDRAADEHREGMELATDAYPAYFEALETHQVIDADDAREDPRTAELADEYLDAHDIGALLDGTLHSEGEVVGVVCHEHVGGPREWTDDEIDFASDVADVVHRAVRNRERGERERELELKTRAMDEAPVGITLADASREDNPIVYANERFEELTGYAAADIRGRNCRILQGEETDPDRVAEMREAIDRPEPVSVELRNYRADGTEFWNRVSIAPVFEEGGDLTHFVGFQQDVGDRKEREHEREATIEFLGELYDVATDAGLDADEKITRLLEVAPRKLDLPYGHLTRIEVSDGEGVQRVVEASGDHELLQPGDSCPLSRSYCRKTIETGGLFELHDAGAAGWEGDPAYELFGLGCYIGTPITVDDELYGTVFFAAEAPRGEPFTDAERTFVRLLSRLVSYELERERAMAELEAQNERLEEFASIISHDLRNPLNVAQGRLELVRGECDSEHLDAIERAQGRIDALITDLLALAREGETAVDLTDVDLGEVVRSCWRNVDTGDATLVADVDRTVRADEGRLRQLFENLVGNSVEHGGPDVTVTVGTTEDGFYVEDDGPGVPENERENVFEAGYSTSEGGTGFGLSIVEEIAETHGWTIRVTESSGGGARFEITGVETVPE